MIKLLCEKCGTPLIAPDQFAGKKGKCRKCGHVNLIPSAGASGDKPVSARDSLIETLAPDTPPKAGFDETEEPVLRPPRRSGRPLGVALVWIIALCAASYFAWPYIWERQHASEIFDLRVRALDLISHGKLRDAIAKYDDLLRLAGNRHIQSKRLSVEIATARQERDDVVARLAGHGAPPAQLKTFQLAGTVSVAWAGATTQPLSGVRVCALHPTVKRAPIVAFNMSLATRIQLDEQSQLRQAEGWQRRIAAGTLNLSEMQQWQQNAAQDQRQAALYHALIERVARLSRELNPVEDVALARLRMLEVDHDYAIVSGRIPPSRDYTGDLLGADFEPVVNEARLTSSITDPAGRYALLDVPEGHYYLYAFSRDGSHAVEWLAPINVGPGENPTINLTLRNASAFK